MVVCVRVVVVLVVVGGRRRCRSGSVGVSRAPSRSAMRGMRGHGCLLGGGRDAHDAASGTDGGGTFGNVDGVS